MSRDYVLINGCPPSKLKPPPAKKTPRDPLAQMLAQPTKKLTKAPRRKEKRK